jgi:hypothetical protein
MDLVGMVWNVLLVEAADHSTIAAIASKNRNSFGFYSGIAAVMMRYPCNGNRSAHLHAQALVLYAGHDCRPGADAGELAAGLRQIGLIGDSIMVDGESRYQAGEHFLDSISFLGCSPYIELEPGADDTPFCHVSFEVFAECQAVAVGRQRPVESTAVIYLWNIHRGEAVPSDPFLASLQEATGCAWRYGYLTTNLQD